KRDKTSTAIRGKTRVQKFPSKTICQEKSTGPETHRPLLVDRQSGLRNGSPAKGRDQQTNNRRLPRDNQSCSTPRKRYGASPHSPMRGSNEVHNRGIPPR